MVSFRNLGALFGSGGRASLMFSRAALLRDVGCDEYRRSPAAGLLVKYEQFK